MSGGFSLEICDAPAEYLGSVQTLPSHSVRNPARGRNLLSDGLGEENTPRNAHSFALVEKSRQAHQKQEAQRGAKLAPLVTLALVMLMPRQLSASDSVPRCVFSLHPHALRVSVVFILPHFAAHFLGGGDFLEANAIRMQAPARHFMTWMIVDH